MRRLTLAVVAVLLVSVVPTTVAAAGAVGAAPAQLGDESGVAALATGAATATNTATENETVEDGEESGTNATSPGQLLSGAIAVQRAELDGDVAGRAYGLAVAARATANARANLVADRVNETEERLDGLEAERERLNESLANGSISEAEYRTEMAVLAAETDATEGMLDRSEDASTSLPAGLLEERGVDATAIETLRNRPANLSGGEVAEIARSIGGPRPGAGAAGRPDDAGRAGVADAGFFPLRTN